MPARRTMPWASSRSPGPQCTSMRACGSRSASSRPRAANFSVPQAFAGPKAPLSLKTTSGPALRPLSPGGNSRASMASARASSAGVVTSSSVSGRRGTPMCAARSIACSAVDTGTRRPRSCNGLSGSVSRSLRPCRAKPTRRRPPPKNASAADDSELGTSRAMSARSARNCRATAANRREGSRLRRS